MTITGKSQIVSGQVNPSGPLATSSSVSDAVIISAAVIAIGSLASVLTYWLTSCFDPIIETPPPSLLSRSIFVQTPGLPKEVLGLLEASTVDSSFLTLELSQLSSLRELVISGPPSDEVMDRLQDCRFLEKVTLQNVPSDSYVQILDRLPPSLKGLLFSNSSVSSERNGELTIHGTKFPNLETVRMVNVFLPEVSFVELKELKGLNITGCGFERLVLDNCQSLESKRLIGLNSTSMTGCLQDITLRRCPKIKYLDLSACRLRCMSCDHHTNVSCFYPGTRIYQELTTYVFYPRSLGSNPGGALAVPISDAPLTSRSSTENRPQAEISGRSRPLTSGDRSLLDLSELSEDQLSSLKDFVISGPFSEEMMQRLQRCCSLEKVILENVPSASLVQILDRLPSSLKDLTLSNSHLEEGGDLELTIHGGKFPNLENLKMKGFFLPRMSCIDLIGLKYLNITECGFKSFLLDNCGGLELKQLIGLNSKSMTKSLQAITLRRCPKIESFDVRGFERLCHVSVDDLTKVVGLFSFWGSYLGGKMYEAVTTYVFH